MTNKFDLTSKVDDYWSSLPESRIHLKYRSHSCVQNHYQDGIKSEIEETFAGHSDTVSLDDIVRNHYSLLPYPFFSRESLVRETYYYNSNKRNIPMGGAFSVTLENINHFLYKGANDFR